MTAPVAHGYSDWRRAVSRADVVWIDASGEVINAQTTYGPFFVGADQFTGLAATASVGDLDVWFRYFSDVTGALQLTESHVELRQGCRVDWSFHSRGPYVSVTVTAAAYPATYDLKLFSTGESGFGHPFFGRSNCILSAGPVNVGAGVTAVFPAARIWPGEAYWHGYFEGGTSNRVLLQHVNYVGQVFNLDYGSQAVPAVGRNVFLPAGLVQISAFNNDAVVRPLYYSILGRSLVRT
jgi:hypothetical protein